MASAPAPGFCDACLVANARAADGAAGTIQTLGETKIPVYVSPAVGVEASAADKRAIVIATDVFGLQLPNVQYVADAIAKASGVTVYIPDILNGDSISPSGFDRATFPAWRARHGDAETEPPLHAAIAALRAKGVEKIAAIGYCFGGRYSLRAAAAGLVEAYAVAHPSFVTPAEFAAVRLPAFFACAETDQAFPAEAAAEVERALAKAGVATEWRRYEGTTHGFGVRPPPGDARAEAARDDAAAGVAAFFAKHLA